MVTRAKKWKKILKYNLAEVGAQIFTKGIEFLEFIWYLRKVNGVVVVASVSVMVNCQCY